MAQNTNRPANNNQNPAQKIPTTIKPVLNQNAYEFELPNGKRGAFGIDGKGLVKLAIWDGKKKIVDFSYRA